MSTFDDFTSSDKAEYLAGPWSYTFDHDGDHAIFSAAGRLIAVTDGIHDLPLEIDEANARLIAAAPELLDACKHALTIAQEYDKTGFAGTIVLKDMLRKAIKKAGGLAGARG